MSRGIIAVQKDSELLEVSTGSLIPCYIGSAPYWQVDSSKWADIAGQAFVLSGLSEARSKIGFFLPDSGRWPKAYSLCEAVYAHFGDELSAVGPIIVLINKASVTVDADAVSANVAMANGVGSIDVDGKAILNTVTIAGKSKGVDYTAVYDDKGQSIIITDINKALGSTAAVTYSVVEGLDTLVMTSGTFDGIDYFEQTIRKIPCGFAAPGWEDALIDGVTDGVTVGEKLVAISEGKINSHWYTQSYIQLTSAARADVATEKATKGYDSPKTKLCWPFVKKGSLVYSLATYFIVAKMKVDINNGNVPFESASNEIINIDGLCDASGNTIPQKESAANDLNYIGVATCNFVSGAWRTWGVCMANYLESNKENILPEYLNDVAVQMRDYVSNDFQAANFDYVDKPIPTRTAKEIVDDYQLTLNNLVNIGALLYGAVSFKAADNSVSSLANGEFVFSLVETSTPPGKSITVKVQYTATGLETYYSKEA